MTTEGNVVVLDPVSGAVQRTLASVGKAGPGSGVALSPDGMTVYYGDGDTPGCGDRIWSVPAAGGIPAVVTFGDLPTISPDGSKLAYAHKSANPPSGCHPGLPDGAIVVRYLRSSAETVYPLNPGIVQNGLRLPVSALSWAADSQRLAVSIAAPSDNVGWRLLILDTRRDTQYPAEASDMGVPVTGQPAAAASYYREGVFMPNGHLFVNRVCCQGMGGPGLAPPSSLLWEVDTSGSLVHQIAIGFTDRDHTSLASDSTGRWLLYLSGRDLYVSEDGRTPTRVTSGLDAAAWG